MTFARTVATAVLALVFGGSSAWAQATGGISGIARDQSAAVLPGVTVTVTQTDTGLVRSTVTNDTGAFALPISCSARTGWKRR